VNPYQLIFSFKEQFERQKKDKEVFVMRDIFKGKALLPFEEQMTGLSWNFPAVVKKKPFG